MSEILESNAVAASSSEASTHSDSEVLVRVENLGKVFCRDFKKSLLYGLQDSMGDLFSAKSDKKQRAQDSEHKLRPGEFWANKDINFELRRGECLGLIGQNGAGKTTLLKMLNGLIKPDVGKIEMRGRVGALIALGAGFNPLLSGRENIYVNGSVLGLTKIEIDEKFDDIVEFAEVRKSIDSPVQTYSSGMQVRLGFAIASSMKPDVLILDEILAVGDMEFQAKCMIEISKNLASCAVVFVSHQEHLVQRICDRVLWLEAGKIVESGPTFSVLPKYIDAPRNRISSEQKETNLEKLDCINIVELVSCTLEVESGDNLKLEILINASSRVAIETFYIAFRDNTGKFVARSTISCEVIIEADTNTNLKFQVKDLRLKRGSYMVDTYAYSNGEKSLVFQFNSAAKFLMRSMIASQVDYQPDAVISV
ncbi:ABC transporter ATP-binding protein [Haloferula chungangensis]|uniref:ABC transporter ATP-binding protein n=1 Tax=Haloferula chungangensis TaxID=1048331 RepID=A0ABW2L9G9_9BACT